jgi:aryl-alcohol dehydrogenase-like predicted oxidoreductase
MKFVDLGGRKASAIGLGLGGWSDGFDQQIANAIVQRAFELGVNFFDTAELYGDSEAVLGHALGGRAPDAIVATKVNKGNLRPAALLAAAERSRGRLQVPTIGLYQVHWPNLFVSQTSTMTAMKELLVKGRIEQVGVSNYSLRLWKRAEAALGRPIVSNQVPFSLIDNAAPKHLLPFAQERGRVIIAYSPIGQGLLGGRYSLDRRPTDYRTYSPYFTRSAFERARPLLEELRSIAARHGATVAQIALAWLLHLPQVIVIPGTRTVAQLEENAAAAEIELSADEWQRLRVLAEPVQIRTGKHGLKAAAAWLLGY